MKYNTIFWDFNGTIIDDIVESIESTNCLLRKRNMKTFANANEYFDVFCFPVYNYYKKAGFDFTKETFEDLAQEYVDNYKRLSKSCKVFDDVKKLLIKYKQDGVKQIMLSSSEKNELIHWITKLDIYKYFDDIIANDNIYGEGKTKTALCWLEKNNIEKTKCILIGDTVHDYEVSKIMGVDCALICRGHNTKNDLLKTGAPVFDDAENMANYLSIQK